MIHRVAASKRYSSSLIEIQTLWSLDDVLDAIEILDMFDQLDAEAHAPKDQQVIRGAPKKDPEKSAV